ncbi:hypothetical protein ACOME3_001234 [Neoechinorhynchus agilis]
MLSSSGDMRICPFDKAHAVKASRFINHVYKCARSHDKKVYSCPYVYDHLFATEDKLLEHLKTCHISGYNKLDHFVAGSTVLNFNSTDIVEDTDYTNKEFENNTDAKVAHRLSRRVVPQDRRKFYQDKAMNFDVVAAKPPQRSPSPIKPAIRSTPRTASSINSTLASPGLEEGEIAELKKSVDNTNSGGLNNRRSPILVRRGRGQGLRKFAVEASKQTDLRLLEDEPEKNEIQTKDGFKKGGFQRMNNCYNEISDEDLC